MLPEPKIMSNSELTSQPQPAWSPGRVIGITLVVLLITIIFYLLYRSSNILFVFFVAIVLATAIRPAVLWFERRGVPLWLGVFIMFFLIALVTVGVIALLAPLLITQGAELVSNFPRYYTQVVEELREIQNPIVQGLVQRLPRELQLGSAAPIAPDQLPSPTETAAQMITSVTAVGWIIFGFVAVLLIIYFWILDHEQIVRTSLLLVPSDQRDETYSLWLTLEEKVGAFVRGQGLLSLSIFVASAIAFLAIGIPNALLLAVLAGIFEVIPYIGPILTGVLAATVTLAQAPEKIWLLIVAFLVIQQLENSVLVPRIMGKTVGVNAVVTLLAIAAFGTLLGVGGAIMAIPLAVVLQVLFQQWVQSRQQVPALKGFGRDQVALLRYQAEEISQDLRQRIRECPSELKEEILEECLEEIVADIDSVLQTVDSSGLPDAKSPAR
jgi:predicted PurR-regulated permease PerM